MNWAIKGNKRIIASPKEIANCPLCLKEVISKCGEINIWHWSHKQDSDCDSFGEPESEWHLNWKNEFPKEQQEIKIKHHRADILTKEGIVIELQNSPISLEQIKEREEFYNNMIWLLNGDTLAKNLILKKNKQTYYTFKWKWFPSSWEVCKKEMYIDLGKDIFLVKKIYYNKSYFNSIEDYRLKSYPCSGWGYLITRRIFLKGFKYGRR